MSRYLVDKILRQLNMDEGARQHFQANPAGFLSAYELAEAERAALLARDCPALYALGAHPFLVFGLLAAGAAGDPRQVVADYVEAIAPYGDVDFAT